MGLISRVSSRTYRKACVCAHHLNETNNDARSNEPAGHPRGPRRLDYPGLHQPAVPGDADLLVARQVAHRLVAHQGRQRLRSANQALEGPQPLCLRRRRLVGHKHDVLSVAFSADNRQIISCGRDKIIKLWNTLGELKWSQEGKNGHNEWVSTVQFSPTTQNPVIVSGGWDNTVKVWHLSNFHLKTEFRGHRGFVNSVTVSPDGSLAASGGQDGCAKLWDLGDAAQNPLHSLEGGEQINKLVFSPNRYWLCAAAGSSIKIWDLEQKQLVEELKVEVSDGDANQTPPKCTCLCWSADGLAMFAGYTDSVIRVWELQHVQMQGVGDLQGVE